MKKLLSIFLTIIIIIGGIVFLGIKEKIEVKAAAGPIAAMKTKVDGYFYVPILNPQSLKVVLLFDDPNIQGDQTGTSGEYSIMPDGEVNIFDITFINGHLGESEGDPNWEYMADCNLVKPDSFREIDIYDSVLASGNFGESGTYVNDSSEITNSTIEFQDAGGNIVDTCNPNSAGACDIPAAAKDFYITDKNGAPIGAYILFYAGPAPTWPHISITAPANVTVGEEFLVSLNYTHDAAEQGGIHLRWLDDKFDITDKAGCDAGYIDNPPYAPGWEGIECGVNNGTTKTFTLKALTAGNQILYHRAWDETKDYDCGDGTFDHNRDPSAGTDPTKGSCTPQCNPDEFPDRWEDCDAYSQAIIVLVSIEICDNGIDDDGDFLIDCADHADCDGQIGPGGEKCCSDASDCNQDDCVIESCSVIDNECDYANRPQCDITECAAGQYCHITGGDCKGLEEHTNVCRICSGFTWTGNGGVLNCCGNDANEDSPYEATESTCNDGNDNDCDGLVDCDDPDCVGDPACAAVCIPDGCNGICPAGCGGADDPDCPGQCLACTCATDNDCANSCAAGDGCCSGCVPVDPDCVAMNPLKFGSFEKLIEGIIDFIFWVAIAIAPIMIIIAAFYFLTSGGDPEKVRKAKSIIFWTIIGLAIVLLAKGIISVIKQIIGG